MLDSKRIGYWWSEKKSHKINVAELARYFVQKGYSFVKIDLGDDIEKQGPFDAIIHKLSDLLCKMDTDEEACLQVKAFEDYVKKRPEVIVIDSLDNVRKLLDRYKQYKIIEDSELRKEDAVFTPTFVEMTSMDVEENLQKMKSANVKFPFVCKPILAHGPRHAHEMSIIFDEKGLKSINPPCVAQTFINHNARLFKLFIIKERYFVIERPSIKNFKPNSNCETVHFDSHDISKPYSSSSLTELDEDDAKTCSQTEPDQKVLDRIVKTISNELGLYLLGIDVIIEKETGRYAIIDINAFPGYDGVDDFLDLYSDIVIGEVEASRLKLNEANGSFDKGSVQEVNGLCLKQTKGRLCNGTSIDDSVNDKTASNTKQPNTNGVYSPNDMDSGIDTSDSCDERKNSKTDMPIKLYKKQHCRWQQQQQQTQDLQNLSENSEKVNYRY